MYTARFFKNENNGKEEKGMEREGETLPQERTISLFVRVFCVCAIRQSIFYPANKSCQNPDTSQTVFEEAEIV